MSVSKCCLTSCLWLIGSSWIHKSITGGNSDFVGTIFSGGLIPFLKLVSQEFFHYLQSPGKWQRWPGKQTVVLETVWLSNSLLTQAHNFLFPSRWNIQLLGVQPLNERQTAGTQRGVFYKLAQSMLHTHAAESLKMSWNGPWAELTDGVNYCAALLTEQTFISSLFYLNLVYNN